MSAEEWGGFDVEGGARALDAGWDAGKRCEPPSSNPHTGVLRSVWESGRRTALGIHPVIGKAETGPMVLPEMAEVGP